MCVCVCVCVRIRLTGFNGIEEILLLCPVFDVSINEEAVHLRVNVLNGYLESVETPCLRHLHLTTEPLNLTEKSGGGGSITHTHTHTQCPFSLGEMDRGTGAKWPSQGEGCVLTRFSLTMPSLAAKKASTCLMKCCSCDLSPSQSPRSLERSTSSAVQNEAAGNEGGRGVGMAYLHIMNVHTIHSE